jgi:hypothetical protein
VFCEPSLPVVDDDDDEDGLVDVDVEAEPCELALPVEDGGESCMKDDE